MGFKVDIVNKVQQCVNSVNSQLPDRASASANAKRTATLEVFRGQRNGRVYRKPTGGTYRASAPGEVPAVRTGALRGQWRPVENNGIPAIDTYVPYTGYMEYGTPGGKIAPRPFEAKIVEKAKPEVLAIYGQPYNLP